MHQEVATFIESKGYDRIDLYAMAVESQGALKAKFIDSIVHKDNDVEEAKLNLAWRSAVEQTDRNLKRGTVLDAVQELDTPLQPGVQEEMKRAFLQVYHWHRMAPGDIGCDALRGRTRRAFEKRQISVMRIARVRSREHVSSVAGNQEEKSCRVYRVDLCGP